MPFSEQEFLQLLRERQLPYGEPFTLKEQTTSTNDDALEALKHGAATGSLFVAEQQTHGRGRHGRHWHSAPGDSLTFSLLLWPKLSLEKLSTVTLVIGLSVLEALHSSGASGLGLKWPNDIVHQKKKLVGVLVEKPQAQAQTDTGLVVGVGINLGPTALPPDLPEATALCNLMPQPPAREPLLVCILQQITQHMTQLETQGLPSLLPQIRHHDTLMGQRIFIDDQPGTARGIGEGGELLVESNSVVRPITAGTVRFA